MQGTVSRECNNIELTRGTEYQPIESGWAPSSCPEGPRSLAKKLGILNRDIVPKSKYPGL